MARGLADFDPAALRAWRLNLYARRGGASRSAEELAEAVGATKAQILAYENGHRVPDPPRIRALARALEVHPVMLMKRRAEDWSVADLRRACGLRAEDVISDLGMSPKSYRRFENEGIVPSRRPQFLDELAAVFGVSWETVERAIDATPAVSERRSRAAHLIQFLADRYVPAPGPWKGPAATDRELLELAAAYGRPLGRTRRVLTHELSELRHKHLRTLRERVVADYDMDHDRQANAHQAVQRWQKLFQRDLERIPQRLEQFHRTAQPSDVWQVLVDLINAEAVPTTDAPWAVTKFATDNPSSLPPHFVQQSRVEDVAVCKLTSAGYSHIAAFAGLYAALHPALRKPLRLRGRALSRPRNPSAGITFALHRHGTSPSVKLVIPAPALDRLQTADSTPAKMITVELSPRHQLSFPPHAGAPGAITHQLIDLVDPTEPGDG